MKEIYLHFCLLLAFIVAGCEKSSTDVPEPQKEQQFGEVTVLGSRLNNPYALANMQAVSKKTLEANCLYVRFLPKDDRDIYLLQMKEIHLYDYPLDYELAVIGRSYHDPSLSEDAITWLYAAVPSDFEFPDVQYEILEKCYIPTDDERELEEAAFINAGYGNAGATKAGVGGRIPLSARLEIFNDNGQGTIEPLRGVKVCWRLFMKEEYGISDNNGRILIPESKFSLNDWSAPEASIIFENDNCSIWKNLHCINAVSVNLGPQAEVVCLFAPDTTASPDNEYRNVITDMWDMGIISNATFDYLEFCRDKGILAPPSDLKIWDWTFLGSSSASMIRRVNGYEGGKVTSFAKALLDTLSQRTGIEGLDRVLPDLTIGTFYTRYDGYKGDCYRIIYKATWHELTHSSHYSQAGDDVWAKYIDYIVKYGAYGNGTVKPGDETGKTGMDICELGECWAYANEHYRQKELFNRDQNTLSTGEWFFVHYQSICKVMDNGVLTREEMYKCLTPDVKSYADFKSALKLRYPGASDKLDELL